MSSAAASRCWSELHADLLAEIFSHLLLVDFIRAAAVCRSWRQLKSKSKPKNQTPWLLLSSLSPSSIQSRYLYTLPSTSDDDDNRGCCYEVHLPEIAGRRCIGSSEGFLIALDKFANLRAINPITGAHIPLPPSSTLPNFSGVVRDPVTGEITAYLVHRSRNPLRPLYPCSLKNPLRPLPPCSLKKARAFCFRKAILSPTTGPPLPRTVVALRSSRRLAFARVGDDRWDEIDGSLLYDYIHDIVFHRGRLHAVGRAGALAVYDLEDPSGSHNSLVCNGLSRDMWPWGDQFYLVEPPPHSGSSDLFLIARHLDYSYFRFDKDDGPTEEEWGYEWDDDADDDPHYEDSNLHPIIRTTSFDVYKLDRDGRQWIRVTCLGDLSLFLGTNCSMALSVRDFPSLKRNCVYFTDDNHDTTFHRPRAKRDMGVFDVGDASVKPLNLSDNLQQLKWPPPIWFTPHLS